MNPLPFHFVSFRFLLYYYPGHNYSSPILELLCFSSYACTLFWKTSPTSIFITDFRIALFSPYIHAPFSRNQAIFIAHFELLCFSSYALSSRNYHDHQRPYSSPIFRITLFSSYNYVHALSSRNHHIIIHHQFS